MIRYLPWSARLARTVHPRLGLPLNSFSSFSTLSFRPIPSSRPSSRPHLSPPNAIVSPVLSRGYALRFDPVPQFHSIADLNELIDQVQRVLHTGTQLVMTQEDIMWEYDAYVQQFWWIFRTLAYLAREISHRSSATGRAARCGFDPYILKIHQRFELLSKELKKLVKDSMTTLEKATEAVSHSSTLQAGIEAAMRFTKAEMQKLETQKAALGKEIENLKMKLRDSERASRQMMYKVQSMARDGHGRLFSDFVDALRAQRGSWENQLQQGVRERGRLYEKQEAIRRKVAQKTRELESAKGAKGTLDSIGSELRGNSGQLNKTISQFREVQDKCITEKDRMSQMYGNYVMKMSIKISLIETSFGTNALAKAVIEVTLLGLKSPENGAISEHATAIADSLSSLDQSVVEAEDEDDPFALGDTSLADKLAELKRELKSTRFSHFVLAYGMHRRPE